MKQRQTNDIEAAASCCGARMVMVRNKCCKHILKSAMESIRELNHFPNATEQLGARVLEILRQMNQLALSKAIEATTNDERIFPLTNALGDIAVFARSSGLLDEEGKVEPKP